MVVLTKFQIKQLGELNVYETERQLNIYVFIYLTTVQVNEAQVRF
jgi:hypothetical protein